MAIIRQLLGAIILFFNWVFTPRSIKRSSSAQTALDAQASRYTLYQYKACPFCVKVRRAMKRLALNIETRDAKRSDSAKEELLAGGGALKVPCLRIEDEQGQIQWMYESNDIIEFLQQFCAPADQATIAASNQQTN